MVVAPDTAEALLRMRCRHWLFHLSRRYIIREKRVLVFLFFLGGCAKLVVADYHPRKPTPAGGRLLLDTAETDAAFEVLLEIEENRQHGKQGDEGCSHHMCPLNVVRAAE